MSIKIPTGYETKKFVLLGPDSVANLQSLRILFPMCNIFFDEYLHSLNKADDNFNITLKDILVLLTNMICAQGGNVFDYTYTHL